MPKHKITKLTLRVRSADDLNWNAESRADAAEFDRGWQARQAGDDRMLLPREASRGFIAGWMAADLAWNARHQVTMGVFR